MARGILGVLIGVLISGIALVGLAAWQGRSVTQFFGDAETVEEKLALMPAETLHTVRVDSEDILAQVKQENYPMLLAFLDLDAQVTQRAVDNYGRIFDDIAKKYTGNTRQQVAEAVYLVHNAAPYYPGLTYLDCLNYVHETLNDNFNSVTAAAQAVYDHLIYAAMKPQLDAQAAQQAAQLAANAQQAEYQRQIDETIIKNKALAEARGAARNAAQAQKSAEWAQAEAEARDRLRVQAQRDYNWNRSWGYYGWYDGYYR